MADVPPDVQVQVAWDFVDEGHGAPTFSCRAVRAVGSGRGTGDECGGWLQRRAAATLLGCWNSIFDRGSLTRGPR
jgi:hypothetical protein